MKKNVRLLNKHNKHWYSHEKNTKWAIQDKDGHWWLVNGSEFPEKKVEAEKVKCGLQPTFDFKKLFMRLLLCAVVGIVLGFAIGVVMAVTS